MLASRSLSVPETGGGLFVGDLRGDESTEGLLCRVARVDDIPVNDISGANKTELSGGAERESTDGGFFHLVDY